MPTLNLRTLGVSYAIEGLVPAGVDAPLLLEDLEAVHGEATVAVGVPIEAILIDHKAVSWDELQEWLESWILGQEYTYASWTRDASHGATASTLHFHR